jgi:hypothetical protein
MGCRGEDLLSPSLADVDELVSPAFAGRHSPLSDTGIVDRDLNLENWSIEAKNIEKGIVIENLDRCTSRLAVARRPSLFTI